VSGNGPHSPPGADAAWPPDATHDRLIGEVFLYQRRRGHRTGTDDVLTAYWATRHGTLASHDAYLDLGCGVGSVLLMTAHRARPAECVGVEAQAESVALACGAVRELPAWFPPVHIVHSDFRELTLGQRFALVTGSPPYFPTSAGVLPEDPQRLACRFELRGGVEAYCDAAARHLLPHGRFVVVHQTASDLRVLAAARSAGLHLCSVLDARMREDRSDPFLSVYEFALEAPSSVAERFPLTIRGCDGEFTPAYREARRMLGVEAAAPLAPMRA
jgi:tRNA1(Val) A37 N6-methylase TrmN6